MTAPKRIRRTPEEARRLILDAAEACMARVGPAGVRLQEVAEAAGVSHPTILHHFQSREGLIQALNQRTLDDLRTALMTMMSQAGGSASSAVSVAFAAYRGGLAERILWMLQSQPDYAGQPTRTFLFDEMVETLHQTRLKFSPPGAEPDRADSHAIVHLTTIAALGDALVGRRLRREPDEAAEAESRSRFEAWLGALIGEHIRAQGCGDG